MLHNLRNILLFLENTNLNLHCRYIWMFDFVITHSFQNIYLIIFVLFYWQGGTQSIRVQYSNVHYCHGLGSSSSQLNCSLLSIINISKKYGNFYGYCRITFLMSCVCLLYCQWFSSKRFIIITSPICRYHGTFGLPLLFLIRQVHYKIFTGYVLPNCSRVRTVKIFWCKLHVGYNNILYIDCLFFIPHFNSKHLRNKVIVIKIIGPYARCNDLVGYRAVDFSIT